MLSNKKGCEKHPLYTKNVSYYYEIWLLSNIVSIFVVTSRSALPVEIAISFTISSLHCSNIFFSPKDNFLEAFNKRRDLLFPLKFTNLLRYVSKTFCN